ncbi:MAG TPA: C40 family peptidase [Dermatophilaceae bacterium]|nr:C40 family peptidase [Dermatophilaceae bacterium]
MRVGVEVTTVWTGPEAPRRVDALAVADHPDPVGWLALLDTRPDDDEAGDGRLGLHGRVHTQVVAGEPVVVVAEHPSGWVEVVLPWQPASEDPRGYPGWVRRAHLLRDDVSRAERRPEPLDPPVPGVLELAREHLGLRYLWGGTSHLGYDCSGLVHHVWRELGVVVPRDADVQHTACQPVELGDEQPGDLYFFARPGRPIHHVGIVVEPGVMIHASETGGWLVEEPLSPARLETRYAAGRLPFIG